MASFAALMKEKGQTVKVSDIVIPKIQMINYKKLKSSKKNFYRQDRIEELADSIELVGMVLQPLVVCKTDMGEYEVLAGHRRLAACTYNVEKKGQKKYEQVPCIEIIASDVIKDMIEEYKEKEMDAEEAMDVFAEYIIIATNSTGRGELTDYEKVMQAARLQIILPIMHGNEELKGRALRAEIAKEMNKSNGMIGNYMNIYNNLIPAGMEMLEHGLLGITMATKICSLDSEIQEELLRQGEITEADIARYKTPVTEESAVKEEITITEMDESESEDREAVQAYADAFEDVNGVYEDREQQKVTDKAAEEREKSVSDKGNDNMENYSGMVYGLEDVEHLLDLYIKQVDRIADMAASTPNGLSENERVLKKSVIIRDALSVYRDRFN